MPRSRNDIAFKFSHNLINSISCLYIPTFRSQAAIVSEKSTVFHFFLGQGQHRVTIYINFIELESSMLHAEFQDHRTSGSGEEDF